MDEPPSWPEDADVGMESVSEQDVLELSDEEDELGISKPDADDEGGEDGEEDEEDDDDDDDGEQYFDTRSASASLSSGGRNQGDAPKSDNDTEEEPIDPVTPGPTSRFDMGASYTEKEDDEIEDDWVEPSMPTPMPNDERFTMVDKPKHSPPQHQHSGSTSSSASASASSQPSTASSSDHPTTPAPPPVKKTKSRDGAVSKKRKGKRQVPVPVPVAKETEAYPFPVTRPNEGDQDDDWEKDEDEPPSVSFDGVEEKPRRMHTARARDGGRTQSGGVKGILTDDLA
jgi:cysteine protease ATG4